MRTLNPTLSGYANYPNATEPLLVIKIEWDSGTVYYSEKIFTFDSNVCKPAILKYISAATTMKQDNLGESGNVNIELDDSDDSIHTILKSERAQHKVCTVYHTYSGITEANSVILMKGKISGDIFWSEIDRVFSCSIESIPDVEDKEVGYALEEGDLAGMANSAIGVPWPMCFGTVVKVPAVPVRKQIKGSLKLKYVNNLIPDRYAVSGAGTAVVNGTYVENGMHNGKPTYCLSVGSYPNIVSYEIRFVYIGSRWCIIPRGYDDNITFALYKTNTSGSTPPSTGWTSVNGADPAPSVNILSGTEKQLFIEGYESFTQDSPITIEAGGVRMTGTMIGDTFTITTANDAKYTNIPLADRVVESDAYTDDSNNPYVLWLSSVTYQIQDYWILINDVDCQYVVKVYKQEGTKCILHGPLPKLVDSTNIIAEVRKFPELDWPIGFITSATNPDEDDTESYISFPYTNLPGPLTPLTEYFTIKEGATVKEITGYNDLFVANLYPSGEVLDVFAWRNLNGRDVFVPVPSSYYTLRLNHDIFGDGSYYVTSIEFPTPLEDYVKENWKIKPLEDRKSTAFKPTNKPSFYIGAVSFIDWNKSREGQEVQGNDWQDTIFVSLRSTYPTRNLPTDANTADIIEFLLTTYTTVTCDATSFLSVHTAIDAYPSNFAVFDQQKAIVLCENIAMQARCALLIKNGIAYLKHLAEVPSSVLTIDESDIVEGSLKLSYTPIEDVVTRVTATWRSDYSGRAAPKTEFKYIYKNNIATYGLVKKDIDIFIYNVEELVEQSVDFWGYRWSNIWRKVSYNTFLTGLKLESFDCITHDVDVLSDNTIRGIIQNLSHESEAPQIVLSEIILASKADDASVGEPIEDTQYWTGP